MHEFKQLLILIIALLLISLKLYAEIPITLCAKTQNDVIRLEWRNQSNKDIAEYSIVKDGVVIMTINDPTMTSYQDKEVKTDGTPYKYFITAITFTDIQTRLSSDTVTVRINHNRNWKTLLLPFRRQKITQNTYDKILYWGSITSLGFTLISSLKTEIQTKETRDKKENYINSKFKSTAYQNWKASFDQEKNWRKALKWSLITYGSFFVLNFIKNGIYDPPREIGIEPANMNCKIQKQNFLHNIEPELQIYNHYGDYCFVINVSYHY